MKKLQLILIFIFCATALYAQKRKQISILDFDKVGSYPNYGLKDKKGKLILPCEFSMIDFEDYCIIVHKGEYRGAFSPEGKVLVPCRYSYVSTFLHEQYIEVHDIDDKKGVVSLDGNIVIPCKYEKVKCIDNRNIPYCYYGSINNQTDFYTTQGKKAFSVTDLEKISYLRREKGRCFFEITNKDGLSGLADSLGVMLPFLYTKILAHDENYLWVDKGEKSGVVDFNNKVILPIIYDYVPIIDNCFVVVKDGKYGVIAMDGRTQILPCEYEQVKVDGEIFRIKRDGKWGYWANGKEIIPCIYDEATEFKNDVATVKKDGEVKLIKNPLKDASQILIAEGAAPSKKKKGAVVSRYPAPDSDVDKDIPSAKRQAENTFAFIIANENYPDAPVPYSLNDGRMFREYCQKALGLPEKNINMYEDATFGNIITAVEKMKSVADAYEGDASVIFYYAGHGFPDDKQSTAYLLPIDGNASDITTTGYSLAKLYKEISQLKLKSSVVFLDACFSGAKREDQMLAQSRGVAIRVRDEAPQGNMVVFSAAQGDETAHQMEEKHHGLFTYFLLKELQATGGDVDMGTLTDYVTKQVKRQSVVINDKKQTPTVIPSPELVNTWRNMKLK